MTLADLTNLAVNAAMIYALIGAVIWIALDGARFLGIARQRRLAGGQSCPALYLWLATALMILRWPWAIAAYLNGRPRRKHHRMQS
jgi:hypothetical protein